MPLSPKDQLTRARIDLLAKYPFYGTLCLRLRLVEDLSIPTLGVDGKNIFYNPNYVEQLARTQYELVVSAMAHETAHCVFDHFSRREWRDKNKWNIAGDYVINGMLKRSKLPLGDGWLFNPDWDERINAETVYNLLPDPPKGGEGGGFPGPGQPGGAQDQVMDADSSKDPALKHEWEVAVQQSALAAKQAGKLPADLERFIKELVAPSIDWRTVMRRFINEVSKNDYSWTRPNKFYAHTGLVLPSLYSERMGTLVEIVDDSGSIRQKILNAFAGEINAIHHEVRPQKAYLVSCDCRVNHVDEFGEFDEFDVSKVVTHGGGGTDFRPPFNWVEEQGVQPVAAIYLTDGYGTFPAMPPPYPVLWCMTTDVVPPWGIHLKIEV